MSVSSEVSYNSKYSREAIQDTEDYLEQVGITKDYKSPVSKYQVDFPLKKLLKAAKRHKIIKIKKKARLFFCQLFDHKNKGTR